MLEPDLAGRAGQRKKAVLINMDFEYDFNGDMFVHLQLRKALSLDAVSATMGGVVPTYRSLK
jgi:hypothetical protein